MTDENTYPTAQQMRQVDVVLDRFAEGRAIDGTAERDIDNLFAVGEAAYDEGFGWIAVIEGEILNESGWQAQVAS